tara:strand:- start:1021 stop:1287 length:267 start_codon:yes stop_codon:yes gene_type:complete
MMDLKIFVDTDADIRLLRRITRDIVERGRDIEGVLKSYNRFVRQAYVDFIKPVSKLFLSYFLSKFYRLCETQISSSLTEFETILPSIS